jgi:hypothetical protein
MIGQAGTAVTVHRMYPPHRGGPVFYSSLSGDTENCKQRLVTALWEHLLALESPQWDHCQASDPGTSFPLQVVYGPLGNPCLRIGESRGPALSFSEGGGRVWAALSGGESAIGIDVAGSDEFPEDYPVGRVFNPEELQHAQRLTGGDTAAACALLWSVKEAFVKALGCAFHFVDPLQVRVSPSEEEAPGPDRGYAFPVGLSAKSLTRFPPSASRHVSVHARPLSQLWLSSAHLDRRLEVHD